MLMSWWIRRNKFGMGLIAIREDEDKAATVGVNTRVYKILAFAASAVFVGMAGGVYGYYLAFIDPIGMFNILLSVQIILSLLLGGRATLWGPVLGAFIVEGLNEFSNNDLGGGNARLLVFGGLLALVVLFMSRGIIPTVDDWIARWRRRGKAGLAGERLAGIDLAARAAPAGPPPRRRRPAAARGQGARAALRRRARGRRRELRRSRGIDHGADRPERLRQDDRLQPDRRHDAAERRRGLVRGQAHRRHEAVGARPPRPRPHLPDHAPVQADDRARERGRTAAVVPSSASSPPTRSAAPRPSARRSCSTSWG